MKTAVLTIVALLLALPAAAADGRDVGAKPDLRNPRGVGEMRIAQGPPRRGHRGSRGYEDDDDDERGRGRGRYKRKHRDRDDYRGRRGGPPHAYRRHEFRRHGPPPWAPAHGWRRNHRHYSGYHVHRQTSVVTYVPPFAIDHGTCNREALGSAIGGLAGALIGSRLSREANRDQRIVAVIGGTILGAVVGGSVGRSMDAVDQNCVGQALEHARDQQPVTWKNDSGAQVEVKPTGTYQDENNRYCREYQTTVIVGGQPQQAYGRACRQPDGSWQKVS